MLLAGRGVGVGAALVAGFRQGADQARAFKVDGALKQVAEPLVTRLGGGEQGCDVRLGLVEPGYVVAIAQSHLGGDDVQTHGDLR